MSALQAASRPTNRSAVVVVAEFEPRLTTADARALRIERQLAAYSTLYAGTTDRINNLQLAIEILDGARIAPGATWSFNEFVGPRTAERGFRSAPVIMNGGVRGGHRGRRLPGGDDRLQRGLGGRDQDRRAPRARSTSVATPTVATPP